MIKIKEEKKDTTQNEVMNSGKPIRAFRKNTNTVDRETEREIKVKVDPDSVRVNRESMITKDDTPDTLREKFPDVSQYEIEFLLFLKDKSD